MPVSARRCWTGLLTALTFSRPAQSLTDFVGPWNGRRRRQKPQQTGRAVEMTDRWKAWKTEKQVFHPSHRPWKSRNIGGIPTFPQLRRRVCGFSGRKRNRPATFTSGGGPKQISEVGQFQLPKAPPPVGGEGTFWPCGPSDRKGVLSSVRRSRALSVLDRVRRNVQGRSSRAGIG